MGWFWSEWPLSSSRTQKLSEEGNVTSPGLSAAPTNMREGGFFGTADTSPGDTNRRDSNTTNADDRTAGSSSSSRSSSSSSGSWSRRWNTIWWCAVTAVVVAGGPKVYKLYLRRVKNVEYLKPEQLRTKSLFGYVTRVGDGDNFRFFHTPLGRLAGWGWCRKIPSKVGELKDETLHVRIAGIDAPELPHFGRGGQPYGQDALDWLSTRLLHRRVRVVPLSKDQYGRVVSTVHLRRIWKRDIGMEMIKAGWATVYEAKSGAEYAGKEQEYRDAEAKAKQKKAGMWGGPTVIGKLLGKRKETLESPGAFKARSKKEEGALK